MSEHGSMRALPPPWYDVIGRHASQDGPYVFTCEHATDNFGPQPIEAVNHALLGTHWAVDLGAAELTRALAIRTDSLAVLSSYSRLLLDANRCLSSKTLFVDSIETQTLACNQSLTDQERQYRIKCLHAGYHTGIDNVVSARITRGPCTLVSMHSFTPVWNDEKRTVEIGVLFDAHEDLAHRVIEGLSKQGFDTRANEPYSGTTGELMYAATVHGKKHQIPYIEFEVRQDLLATKAGIAQVCKAIALALEEAAPKADSPSTP
jgi:predicted N-formylglutamate amidohydrolase